MLPLTALHYDEESILAVGVLLAYCIILIGRNRAGRRARNQHADDALGRPGFALPMLPDLSYESRDRRDGVRSKFNQGGFWLDPSGSSLMAGLFLLSLSIMVFALKRWRRGIHIADMVFQWMEPEVLCFWVILLALLIGWMGRLIRRK